MCFWIIRFGHDIFWSFDEEKLKKTTRNDSTRGRYFSLWMCVLKINHERKFLPFINHRCISKEVVSQIKEVSTESKFWTHLNLRQTSFWFTYSFKFHLRLNLYCRFEEKYFAKENNKRFKAFKNPQKTTQTF